GLGHPPAGHGRHVGHHQRDRAPTRVPGAQVRVEPGRHPRPAGHHEDVAVGQVVTGFLIAEESHVSDCARRAGVPWTAFILLPVTESDSVGPTHPPASHPEADHQHAGHQRTLRLGPLEVPPGSFAVMAVVNRTPDSFYDRGATYEFRVALGAASQAVADGAGIIDIGGVKAGDGDEVDVAEEIRRVAGLVAAVRERHPAIAISVDPWRAEVGRAVADAGADLLNDAWGGFDPELAKVAAGRGLGLVCSHASGPAPRTL